MHVPSTDWASVSVISTISNINIMNIAQHRQSLISPRYLQSFHYT